MGPQRRHRCGATQPATTRTYEEWVFFDEIYTVVRTSTSTSTYSRIWKAQRAGRHGDMRILSMLEVGRKMEDGVDNNSHRALLRRHAASPN
eukprot:9023386-Pyramimonas_sp.AAC.1